MSGTRHRRHVYREGLSLRFVTDRYRGTIESSMHIAMLILEKND